MSSRKTKDSRPQVAPPAQIDAAQRYTLRESCAILRQSPAKTFVDIKAGKLQVIRDGGRTYVPGTELIRRSKLQSEA